MRSSPIRCSSTASAIVIRRAVKEAGRADRARRHGQAGLRLLEGSAGGIGRARSAASSGISDGCRKATRGSRRYDFTPVVEAANNGRWPGRDQVFVLLGATFVEGPRADRADNPRDRARARSVRQSQRDAGRPLQGAEPLRRSAARGRRRASGISCCSRRTPRSGSPAPAERQGLRSGSGPPASTPAGGWRSRAPCSATAPASWLAGESVRLTTAPTEMPVEVARPSASPPEPPPKVIFSAPLADETDFPLGGPCQDPVLARHERPDVPRPHPRPLRRPERPRPSRRRRSRLTYNDGNRSLEIRFKEPLEPFQSVVDPARQGSPRSTASR